MDVCERFPQSHSFSTNVGTRHEFAVDVASVQAELFASHAKVSRPLLQITFLMPEVCHNRVALKGLVYDLNKNISLTSPHYK